MTAITDRDPETIFSQRPTHPVRPPRLADAWQSVRQMHKELDDTIEARLAGSATWADEEAAQEAAWAAETYYRELWTANERGLLPADYMWTSDVEMAGAL